MTQEGQTLGAFVNGEVRGVSPAIYIEQLGEWLFFLTIYANQSGEPMTFKVFDETTEEVSDLEQGMLFSIDGFAGTVDEPVPFSFATALGDSETGRPSNSLFVHPNPFSQYTTIRFRSMTDGEATLTMTDVVGRVVKYAVPDAFTGWNELRWDTADLTAGVYFVKVETGGKTLACKVLAR